MSDLVEELRAAKTIERIEYENGQVINLETPLNEAAADEIESQRATNNELSALVEKQAAEIERLRARVARAEAALSTVRNYFENRAHIQPEARGCLARIGAALEDK